MQSAGDSISWRDCQKLKKHLIKAAQCNGLQRNNFGMNPVIRDLQTAVIVAEEIGMKGSCLIGIMLHEIVKAHILSIEDVQMDGDTPWAGFDLINDELSAFDPELAERRQIEVVNKIDLRTPEELDAVKARAEADGRRIFFVSAKEGTGLDALVAEMWKMRDDLDLHEPLVRFADEEEIDEDFPDVEVVWVKE